ncbi:DUF655 domain-containing protein [Pannus brasiliensis CCIBt3594]|uniref:DUF655 domain-containing protein n=1 Tax=Pannus brasiliensis CCIBt3594 TaxID=1427578 RepID=A0AAW9QE63_9CHRO
MWKFLRIDIENIASPVDPSTFNDNTNDTLEHLATLIIEMGGLVCPITLEKISIEQYEVLSGHLEYYASKIASERDPSIETINAIVVDKEGVENASQQIDLIGKGKSSTDSPPPDTFIRHFNYLQNRLEKYFGEVRQFQEERKTEIHGLAKTVEQLLPPIPKPTIIEVLNNYSAQKLTSMGLRKNMVNQIIEERKKKAFESFSEMRSRVQGWGVATIEKFLDFYDNL